MDESLLDREPHARYASLGQAWFLEDRWFASVDRVHSLAPEPPPSISWIPSFEALGRSRATAMREWACR